jgi:RHS repeat-associated protein
VKKRLKHLSGRCGVGCALLLALAPSLAADKSGVGPNTISLPKGPGSIEGLGEAFQPTLNTGTAKYRVGLSLPPGTGGHSPQVALSYEGGAGNGILGFGWRLPVAYVQRETDKGIPRYIDGPNGLDDDGDGMVDNPEEMDMLINESKEELVLRSDGFWFCKNEGAFIRYRRAGDHWEATEPDGTRMEFGLSPSARVQDPLTGRAFSWLVERTTDTKGNVMRYVYQGFPGDQNTNQVYLVRIEYGPGAPPWQNFHFVTFSYEDRADWFEDCRAGFPVRTGKRLKEIAVGTQGPTLAGHLQGDFNGDGIPDNLVRKYRLDYWAYAGTNSHWSYLATVTPVGADGVGTLPPSRFTYSICDPPDVVSATDKILGGLNEPPWVMDNPLVELVDLNGDGVPDILKTGLGGGAHVGYLNMGETNVGGARAIVWSPPIEVASADGLAWTINLQSGSAPSDDIAHLADMDGDGMADLVYQSPFNTVYYFKNLGRRSWGPRLAMSVGDSAPPSPFGQANVKTADLNFDKRIDVIQSIATAGGADYRIWFNLGDQRYSTSVTVPQENGFMLSDPGVEIADFNGDRVPDVVRVRPTVVEITAGLGYGHFAPLITVAIPDATLDDVQISHARLEDITGDGLPDLVIERAEPGVLWYWINLGNYTFSAKKVITGLPAVPLNGVIRWADLNGNGTTDYIIASSDNAPRIQAVDLANLIGCVSGPNLLNRIENGLGRVTEIEYQTSSAFALQDAAQGQPWPDPMPFPVSVVSRVRTADSLGHSYVTEFYYHDGYYDGAEKEFRGFARVEQVDIGDPTAPTLVTRSYFDTGREFEVMKGKVLRLTAETESGAVFTDETTAWTIPPLTLYTATNGQAVRYAHPTGNVKLVKELGQGTERCLEAEFDFDTFGNQTRYADYGIVVNGDRWAFHDERNVTTEYAINTNAWLIREPMRTQVMDASSNVICKAEFYYDDETFAGNNLGQIALGNLTLKREWKDPADASAYVSSARTKHDTYGNPLIILDPLAAAPGGAVDLSKGHARAIAYDDCFHTYPKMETIHIGGGGAPLTFQAAYDYGFGTVTSSTDFNTNSTAYGYDTFARLTSIVRPGDSNDYPTSEYDYALAVPFQTTNLVNFVETRQLDKPVAAPGSKRDHYFISRQFVDGLGRKLLAKQEAGALNDGGPPRVTVKEAVTFNARQKAGCVLNPFYSMLSGSLDDQLAYESIEAPGWSGQFELNGNLVTLNLSAAHATSTEYDATLREVKTTNPDGTFRQTVFEPLLTRSFDENDTDPASPNFNTPMVHYTDGLGRLIRVDELARLNDDGVPAGTVNTWSTFYQYDVNDQLTQLTDSQNNQKFFQYDGLKRKTFMNDPDRGVMNFAYDDASNLIETMDAKNQRITYTYDGANRIRSEDYHDEGLAFSANYAFVPSSPISPTNRPDVAYFYDAPQAGLDVGDGSLATGANTRGKLAYVWDLSGEEHTSYDPRDRVDWVVKRVRDPIHSQLVSFRTSFTYDSLDRLTGLTYPDNDAIGYEYNDRTLLARIQGGQAGVLTQNGYVISGLNYWPSDQKAEIRYGNGIRTDYAYDERLRLKNLNTAPQAAPASPLIAFGYQFDGVSNIRRIDDQRPESVVPAGDPRRNSQLFQYDDLYRITRAQYSFALPGQSDRDDGQINYRYDRIGNMLAQTSTLINHVENGLPVANLGAMDSGGGAGGWNRAGRAAKDPPGPHALTAIRNSQFATRNYLYDFNGNMTNLDGMVATWDFKDRLLSLENADMRADYTYDFTDRRITKKVFWKHGEPALTTNQPSIPKPRPSTTTVTYVGKHFEVREHEAPTKYVFNGNTRVARVTGTLSPNQRVQRLRVSSGWNLLSVAVDATNGGAQLAATGQVDAFFRWNSATRAFESALRTDTLIAGSVLWVHANAAATLRVLGAYPGPGPHFRATPEGDFLAAFGLEILPLMNQPPTLNVWRFCAGSQGWQTKVALPLLSFSDLPLALEPSGAIYAQAHSAVELKTPDPVLSLRYYHQDHLCSSTVITDSGGTRFEEAENYPFGCPRNVSYQASDGEAYQFTQKEMDLESGLHCLGARFLFAGVGHFITVDPAGDAPMGSILRNPQLQNAYSYALNRPITYIDPSGGRPSPCGDIFSIGPMTSEEARPIKECLNWTYDEVAEDARRAQAEGRTGAAYWNAAQAGLVWTMNRVLLAPAENASHEFAAASSSRFGSRTFAKSIGNMSWEVFGGKLTEGFASSIAKAWRVGQFRSVTRLSGTARFDKFVHYLRTSMDSAIFRYTKEGIEDAGKSGSAFRDAMKDYVPALNDALKGKSGTPEPNRVSDPDFPIGGQCRMPDSDTGSLHLDDILAPHGSP